MPHALLAEEVALAASRVVLAAGPRLALRGAARWSGLVAWALMGCGATPSAEREPTRVEVRAGGGSSTVAVSSYPGERNRVPAAIAWYQDLPEARAESRRSGRHLLIYLRADWSVPSVEMERDLWPTYEARQTSARFIPVMIDVSDVSDPERQRLALEHQAERLPTVMVATADGAILARHTGAMTAEQLRDLVAGR